MFLIWPDRESLFYHLFLQSFCCKVHTTIGQTGFYVYGFLVKIRLVFCPVNGLGGRSLTNKELILFAEWQHPPSYVSLSGQHYSARNQNTDHWRAIRNPFGLHYPALTTQMLPSTGIQNQAAVFTYEDASVWSSKVNVWTKDWLARSSKFAQGLQHYCKLLHQGIGYSQWGMYASNSLASCKAES